INGPNLPDTNLTVYTPLVFTPANSNLIPFINTLPDKVSYDFRVRTNYNGQPGVRDNFVTENSKIAAYLDFDAPLKGSFSQFRLKTRTEFSAGETTDLDNIQSGTLRLLVENRFPVQGRVTAIVYDAAGQEITRLAENSLVQAGLPDASGYVTDATISTLEKSFDAALLKEVLENGRELLVEFVADTRPDAQDVKIYADYKLKVKLTGQFTYRVQ
ncbi:MAG: hypothetical protein EAZ89_21450, partial [Bacteroidetes bacterium]